MYFDGATRTNSNEELTSGVGIIIFITPEGHMIPHSFSLTESCSNNVAEYKALWVWRWLTKSKSIILRFAVIVTQMNGKYAVKKQISSPTITRRLARNFRYFNIEHIPRGRNARADALAGLAASMSLPDGESLNVVLCERKILPPLNTHRSTKFGQID